jgi:hypothetical protein
MARVSPTIRRAHSHTLTFRGKPLETGAAVDQHYPEGLLELFYPRRQSRLGDTTSFGGAAKKLREPMRGEIPVYRAIAASISV